LNYSTPEKFSFLSKSTENRSTNLEVTVGLRKGHDLVANYLIKVKKIFHEPVMSPIKNAEFYADFKI
jgi:hypothetical protein